MGRIRFVDILRLLATRDVEFIVVGMTAGILQATPTTDAPGCSGQLAAAVTGREPGTVELA